MKILFFSHYFPPEANAPANRTFEHCRRWVSSGHEVTVVTCFPSHPEGRLYPGYSMRRRLWEDVDGIRVLRVRTYLAANSGTVRRILNYVSYMFAATVNALRVPRPDVVVATSPQFFCGWAGLLCKWLRRLPFVLEVRDMWPESIIAVGALKPGLVTRILERMERVLYREADHIITVGAGYKRKIVEKGIREDKISIVPNGVDLQNFVPTQSSSIIRQELGAVGKFVCAYVGTVGMASGLHVVIDAAARLKEMGENDVAFWVVGSGAIREDLEKECVDRGLDSVVFTGHLPRSRISEVLMACDAGLVHLKGTDLFGTVLPSKVFELMAMNTPIIMGVQGEAMEIVMKAGAGVPMVPDDADSLIKCIAEIRRKGRDAFKGRDFVSRNYDRDLLAEEMIAVLSNVGNFSISP